VVYSRLLKLVQGTVCWITARDLEEAPDILLHQAVSAEFPLVMASMCSYQHENCRTK